MPESRLISPLFTRAAHALAPCLRMLARKKPAEYFDPVQFLKFCCAGAANALVDFAVYAALVNMLPIYLASSIAWLAACCFSYAINKRWIFHAKTQGLPPLARFAIVNILSQGLRIVSLYLLTAAGPGKIAAYIITAPFVALANYFGYKFWSFT